jgi:hypothetical protein
MSREALYWRLYTRAFKDDRPADLPIEGLPIVIGMDPRGEAHGDEIRKRVRA